MGIAKSQEKNDTQFSTVENVYAYYLVKVEKHKRFYRKLAQYQTASVSEGQMVNRHQCHTLIVKLATLPFMPHGQVTQLVITLKVARNMP